MHNNVSMCVRLSSIFATFSNKIFLHFQQFNFINAIHQNRGEENQHRHINQISLLILSDVDFEKETCIHSPRSSASEFPSFNVHIRIVGKKRPLPVCFSACVNSLRSQV